MCNCVPSIVLNTMHDDFILSVFSVTTLDTKYYCSPTYS